AARPGILPLPCGIFATVNKCFHAVILRGEFSAFMSLHYNAAGAAAWASRRGCLSWFSRSGRAFCLIGCSRGGIGPDHVGARTGATGRAVSAIDSESVRVSRVAHANRSITPLVGVRPLSVLRLVPAISGTCADERRPTRSRPRGAGWPGTPSRAPPALPSGQRISAGRERQGCRRGRKPDRPENEAGRHSLQEGRHT